MKKLRKKEKYLKEEEDFQSQDQIVATQKCYAISGQSMIEL